jgi:hypothetical protein
MAVFELTIEFLLAGVAGGMLGAALGAVPTLSLAGVLIVVGEAFGTFGGGTVEGTGVENTFDATPATVDAVGLTGVLGLGPVLGPHVAFAGGVGAAAFLGRKETFDTTFRYHQAKNIAKPLGSAPRAMVVGGVFGVFGVVVARVTAGVNVPVDPIFFTVVVSGFVHRLVFGYPLVGRTRGADRSLLDMSPHKQGKLWGQESHETSQGTEGRKVVEVWLPDHYEWEHVAVLGLAVGLAAGFIALASGSVFLAFGLSLASLVFLASGAYSFPVTHHMSLPAGISAVAMAAEFDPLVGLVVAGVFGVLGGILGEVAQRLFYAHGDTHVDPSAISIVLTSLLITLLGTAGLFEPDVIPYPVF